MTCPLSQLWPAPLEDLTQSADQETGVTEEEAVEIQKCPVESGTQGGSQGLIPQVWRSERERKPARRLAYELAELTVDTVIMSKHCCVYKTTLHIPHYLNIKVLPTH